MSSKQALVGAIAAAQLMAPPAASAANNPAAVIVVWHVGAPDFADPNVEAAQAGLDAPALIGGQLRALKRHPAARFTFAIDAGYLAALRRAANGDTLFKIVAAGGLKPGDQRVDQLLRALARAPRVEPRLANAPAGRRFATLASAVPLALAGSSAARFSSADIAELVAAAIALQLGAADSLNNSGMLSKSEHSRADLMGLVSQLGRADQNIVADIKAQSSRGRLELAAVPAGEPVLPLLVDAAGRSTIEPNIVSLSAGADAARLVADAFVEQARFAASGRGFYSPYGAYDDATADLLRTQRASYALFSDRTLRAASGAGSRSAIEAADAAAYQPYLLQNGKNETLPALFWKADDSDALCAIAPSLPAATLASRVVALARVRPAKDSRQAVLTLRVEAGGPWAQRSDRDAALDRLAGALAADPLRSTTPSQFLRDHPPKTVSYGFGAASDAGGFSLWMGSNAQASLWQALAGARKAAGGDRALERSTTREPLLQAEAARWFAVLAAPQPSSTLDQTLRQFRALIARIYRAAGRAAPAQLPAVTTE